MIPAEKRKRIEELKRLIEEKKKEHDQAKAMQLALKLFLNGTYGAFANKHFVLSNFNIANAITAHGRDILHYMIKKIESYFYDEWHFDTKTQSLLGLEYVAKKLDGSFCFLSKGFRETGSGKDIYDLLKTRNTSEKHLIKNEFKHEDYEILYTYKIWNFEEIKSINPTHLIKPENDPDGLGTRQEPVIIYGDTDSIYVSYAPIMKSAGFDQPGRELEFILHLNFVAIKNIFGQYLEEYALRFKVKNIQDFELETINRSGLHIEKKNYINNVVYEEGVFYQPLTRFISKGVQIVRSSTPPFVRERIWDFLNYLFSNPDNLNINDILKIVKKLRKEFALTNIEDISMTTSCTNYSSKVLNDTTSVETVLGAHFGVKAACFHNYLLNKNSEYKTKYDLIRGGRIKYYYCNHPLNEVFAYARSFHPMEIIEKEGVKIDIDTQFEKTMLSIINGFLDPMGLPLINKRLSVLNGLFNF